MWSLAVGLSLAGCASPTYHKSDAAAVSMVTAATDVQEEARAIDAALESLNNLAKEPTPDLKKSYQHFSTTLSRLITAAQRTDNSGRRMAERNGRYLETWDQQLSRIDFEHIRELSQARRSEVSRRFEAVQLRYEHTQEVVHPLITYLQDVHKALGADLTVAGLASMQPVFQNAGTNASKVQVALRVLIDELNDSGSRLSSLSLRAVAPSP